MGKSGSAALLCAIGFMLLWPYILTKSDSSKLQTTASTSPSPVQEEERPRVEKVMTKHCDSTLDNYCFNNGQCMLLLEINEHHCKCVGNFYGPRCGHLELVFKPMGEEQLIAIIVFVILLIIGLAGALYFCCKRNSSHSKGVLNQSSRLMDL